jgi:predicted SnoaL-like aldol condensation-catalyzing enzyme
LSWETFDTLFNKRDYARAAAIWAETYIQHSAHIPPGRDGLFNLVRGLPDTLRYESSLILAEGDYVMLHGRFSGHGRPRSWIAADILGSDYGDAGCHARLGGSDPRASHARNVKNESKRQEEPRTLL